MEYWNVKHLTPPASSSCKLLNQEINLHEVNGLMNDALALFSSQIFLDAESKVLQSLVKINGKRYRHMIGFKYLQKLNRCIRNYNEADFKSTISWFIDFLPRRFEADTYFPSRNVLDFMLVRTLGIGKLLVRVLEICKQVYIHWIDRIQEAHLLVVGVAAVAMQARLFIISRYLIQCLCHLYDSLLALRDKVPNIKYNWLPATYKLPATLMPWLDASWAYAEHHVVLRGKDRDLFSIDLFDDDDADVQFCKEYRIVDDDADLQIVNEYLNIIDNDGDDVVDVDAINDDLQYVGTQVRSALSKGKSRIINLDDEIGEPVEQNAKLEEVKRKIEEMKTLDAIETFVTDGSHSYFRSLGMDGFTQLLSTVRTYKLSSREATRKKDKMRIINEVKAKIIETVQAHTS